MLYLIRRIYHYVFFCFFNDSAPTCINRLLCIRLFAFFLLIIIRNATYAINITATESYK